MWENIAVNGTKEHQCKWNNVPSLSSQLVDQCSELPPVLGYFGLSDRKDIPHINKKTCLTVVRGF